MTSNNLMMQLILMLQLMMLLPLPLLLPKLLLMTLKSKQLNQQQMHQNQIPMQTLMIYPMIKKLQHHLHHHLHQQQLMMKKIQEAVYCLLLLHHLLLLLHVKTPVLYLPLLHQWIWAVLLVAIRQSKCHCNKVAADVANPHL